MGIRPKEGGGLPRDTVGFPFFVLFKIIVCVTFTYLILDLSLDVVDGVGGLHLEGDGLSGD